MNHSLPYSQVFDTVEQKSQSDYKIYDAVIAAITDINLTVPSHRRITLDCIVSDNHGEAHELHVKQGNNTLCVYEIDMYPHFVRRMWAQITLGLAHHETVETIKGEVLSVYQYGERAIH